MPKGSNNMDNKSDKHLIVIKYTIEANKKEMKSNRQNSGDKMMKVTEHFKEMLVSAIISMMGHINMYKSSLDQMD